MDDFEGKNIGFVGLGAMGTHMARHLAEKLPRSAQIFVYDINETAVDDLCHSHEGTMVKCRHARDVAERSDIIISMLPEGKHVKDVYMENADSICSSDVSGKMLIDCSTIDRTSSLHVKDFIAQRFPTTSFYDAPVSGGTLGAEKATISFFLGCNENDPNLPKLMNLLGMMGKKIIPCGGPSLGVAAKLSNNYLSGIITIASSEAMDMGMRSGLDPRVLARVFAAGTAQNNICDVFNPVPGVLPEAPSSKGYAPGFKVQLMRKDFSLALEMAKNAGANNVLGETGLRVYDEASNDERCRDLDSRVVYRYLGGMEDWQQHFDR